MQCRTGTMITIKQISTRTVSCAHLLQTEHFARDGFGLSLVWAALAGFAGALATMLFRACISALVWLETGHVTGLVEAARALPPTVRVLVPTTGGLIAGTILWLARRRGRRESGGDYMESIVIGDGIVPPGESLLRSVSSLFSIASGGSIGREGPMVQLAAAVASLIARAVNLGVPQRRLLVACGAAAGLTAAYNAPLAGALFVAEIVLGSIAIESLVPLLVAAMVANLTTHVLAPDVPLYPIEGLAHVHGATYVSYAAIGIVAGLCGPLFLGLINATRRRVERMTLPLPLKMMMGGLVVGIISVRVPEVWGNGYSTINAILQGQWIGGALLIVLLCKIAATASTVGSGAIGGVFTPTLFVGAALGSLMTQGFAQWMPDAAPQEQAGAAVAMGAFLAATTQAPLTSILMVLEMTGAYVLVLPLMLACVVAQFVIRMLRAKSIYAAAEHRRQLYAAVHDLSLKSVAALLRPSPPTLRMDDQIPAIVAAFDLWRFQYLYVVDTKGHYLGAISLHDLRKFLAESDASTQADCVALALTTKTLQVLNEDMTLEQALALFRAHRGERLPLVGNRDLLLGAVWKTDVLLELQQRLSLVR